ncbi:hypothetical protein CYMTET_18852, partial [Cymbomonas tetramitiformis]|eukprot:gene6374-7638_t
MALKAEGTKSSLLGAEIPHDLYALVEEKSLEEAKLAQSKSLLEAGFTSANVDDDVKLDFLLENIRERLDELALENPELNGPPAPKWPKAPKDPEVFGGPLHSPSAPPGLTKLLKEGVAPSDAPMARQEGVEADDEPEGAPTANAPPVMGRT